MAPIDIRMMQRILAMLTKSGRSIVYRRVTVSSGYAADQNPPSLESATTDGVTLVGAGTVTLDADGWFGKLVAGDSFSATGHAAPYVIQADQTIANGQVTVSVLPVVAAEIPDNTSVTFAFSADTTILARISSKPNFYRGGTLVEESRLAVIFKGDALSVRPKTGDIMIIDGEHYRVSSPTPEYIKETVGLWRVQAE
jgi:hypothetical protein